MTVYVFAGPTVRPEEVAAALPGAICLPPVAQGDVYRVARTRPQAIGIIDGYFSGAPSVWHKEILWALSEGVPVYGSASMGALRAAELHPFGMRGVGRIFEAFASGALEDDDEVAVVHGPPETGYIAASEPMVNIRATLDRAEAESVISNALRLELETAAKAMFFPRRTWPALLKAITQGDKRPDLTRLKEWLPGGSVDQKKIDALEMLAAMRSASEVEVEEPQRAGFRFERTHFWDDLARRTAEAPADAGGPAGSQERILEELRLEGPEAYEAVKAKALLCLLAEEEARRRGAAPASDALLAAATETRTALGLFSRDRLQAWMAENDLDERSFGRIIETQALLKSLAEAAAPALERFLLHELRLSGRYPVLSLRASKKAEQIEKTGLPSDRPVAAMPNAAQLRAWHFEQRLGRTTPDDVEAYARALGFAGPGEFDRALRRDWMYARFTGGRPGDLGETADTASRSQGG